MPRKERLIGWLLPCLLLICGPAWGQDAQTVRKMYGQAKPSLVAVKYTWASELGSRELVAAGVVISDDGLVMFPLSAVTPALIPDDQMRDFKIVIPTDNGDDLEVDATLQGRDERCNLAFVRANSPRKWTAVKFMDAPPQIGELVYSIGLLPKNSGYRAHITAPMISVRLRGPIPQYLVDSDLAGVGSVVLDGKGRAIGWVHPQSITDAFLDNPQNVDDIPQITSAPKLFVPASDFLLSLQSPPSPAKPLVLPWIGCEMKGMEKDDAEYFGLANIPAVQVGDVIADAPAGKAGMKELDIVTKINGEPIERGDMPRELPEIVMRKIQRMNVGDKLTFTVIHQKGDTPRDVVMTLTRRPIQPHEAHRYYARELGFVVRDVTFWDTYQRKISPTTHGVVVALLRPQAAAQAAKLATNDLVLQMNGKPVVDLDGFKKDYLQFRKDRPNDPLVLEISQLDGKQQTINIEPPQTNAQPEGN